MTFTLDLLQYLDAFHSRHHDVQHDHLRHIVGHGFEGRFSVMDNAGVDAPEFQSFGQGDDEIDFIVYQKDVPCFHIHD
jgi:hypothetical protein